MVQLKENISVNDSLRVQPALIRPVGETGEDGLAVVGPTTIVLGGPGVWIERRQGGLIGVQLEEIDGLIAALAEAQARIKAYLAGEDYQENLF
jgi:hypothetical protein